MKIKKILFNISITTGIIFLIFVLSIALGIFTSIIISPIVWEYKLISSDDGSLFLAPIHIIFMLGCSISFIIDIFIKNKFLKIDISKIHIIINSIFSCAFLFCFLTSFLNFWGYLFQAYKAPDLLYILIFIFCIISIYFVNKNLLRRLT